MSKLKSSMTLSTISYNTEEWLQERLEMLVNNGAINYYIYIRHLPEEDEKKAHFHVFLDPNGPMQLKGLRDWFDELDPENPAMPLRCLPFHEVHKGNFPDWWLYSLHDTAYLLWKQESRKYHYTPEDMVTNDPLAVEELVREIDYSVYTHDADLYTAIKAGATVSDLVENGLITMDKFYKYSAGYYAIRGETFRGNNKNHEETY